MIENWKVIPIYPAYEASNIGNIRSSRQILTPSLSTSGYKHVCLSINKKPKTQYVHRLVVEAFLPTPNSKNLIVNHKDKNKLNNNVDNLEWCIAQENRIHLILFGDRNNNISTNMYNMLLRLNILPKKEQKKILKQWEIILKKKESNK